MDVAGRVLELDVEDVLVEAARVVVLDDVLVDSARVVEVVAREVGVELKDVELLEVEVVVDEVDELLVVLARVVVVRRNRSPKRICAVELGVAIEATSTPPTTTKPIRPRIGESFIACCDRRITK